MRSPDLALFWHMIGIGAAVNRCGQPNDKRRLPFRADYPADQKTKIRNGFIGEAVRSPTYPSCMPATFSSGPGELPLHERLRQPNCFRGALAESVLARLAPTHCPR